MVEGVMNVHCEGMTPIRVSKQSVDTTVSPKRWCIEEASLSPRLTETRGTTGHDNNVAKLGASASRFVLHYLYSKVARVSEKILFDHAFVLTYLPFATYLSTSPNYLCHVRLYSSVRSIDESHNISTHIRLLFGVALNLLAYLLLGIRAIPFLGVFVISL